MWNARKGLLNKGNTITDRIVHIVLHTDDWSVLSSSMSGNVRTDERVSGFAHMIPFSNDCVDKTRPFCRTTISFGGYNLPYYCGGDWDYCAEEDGNVQVWVPEAGVAVEGHEIPFNPWITSWRKSDSTVRCPWSQKQTASSETILQQRRSKQWKISMEKQWSLFISAIEDDTSLFPKSFSSTVPRSPPCTSFTSISSASRHHLPRWKEVSLFRDASCWVDEMESVIGKNTFDKLAREIAAELGKIPRVIQPIPFVVQAQPFWRR